MYHRSQLYMCIYVYWYWYRVFCYTVHPVLARLCLPGQLHITPSVRLFAYLAQSWYRSTLVKVGVDRAVFTCSSMRSKLPVHLPVLQGLFDDHLRLAVKFSQSPVRRGPSHDFIEMRSDLLSVFCAYLMWTWLVSSFFISGWQYPPCGMWNPE